MPAVRYTRGGSIHAETTASQPSEHRMTSNTPAAEATPTDAPSREVPSKESPAKDAPGKETTVLLEFMYRLGQAYLASGEQTAQVELQVRRVGSAHGLRRARVVAFPTTIFISVDDGTGERVTLAEGPISSLRLDQISDVYTLGAEVQKREKTPAEGLAELTAILRKPARFGTFGIIAGHTVISTGLAMVLMPTPGNLIAAALLGTFVGGLKAVRRKNEVLAVPLSVVASVLVSAIVFLAARYGAPVEPLHALIPPLVTFLPGAMLAMGMVEIAYGDMVSGTSRLVNGFVQLVLLAFGLAAGAAIAGVGMAPLLEAGENMTPIAWVSWLGVLVFGVGVHIHFSAPKKSLGWQHLVLLATFAAQQASSHLFGSEYSGFFGAMVATPLVYLIQLKFNGPPAMVTFLPSFWLLVPGALGLISVKRMLSDRAAGLEGLTAAVFVFAAIALGTLMGASLYKWITETFAGWQMQIGRSARKVRTKVPEKEPAKSVEATQTDAAAKTATSPSASSNEIPSPKS